MNEIKKKIEKVSVELPTETKMKIDMRMPVINSVESVKDAVKLIKTIQAVDYVDSYNKMFDASIKSLIRDELTDVIYQAKSISIREKRDIQEVISELVIQKVALRRAKDSYTIRGYQMRLEPFVNSLKIDEKLAMAGFSYVQGVKDYSVRDWVDEMRVAVETYEFLEEWESLKNKFTEVKVKIGTSLYQWKKVA